MWPARFSKKRQERVKRSDVLPFQERTRCKEAARMVLWGRGRCLHAWCCGSTSQLWGGKTQKDLFLHQLWIKGQEAEYTALWIWAMISYRMKLLAKAWETEKVSLTFLVTFHSSVLMPCTGKPQAGRWWSLTSALCKICRNHLLDTLAALPVI